MELRAGAVMGNMAVGSKYLQTMEFCCAPGIEHFTTVGVEWVNKNGESVMKRFRESEEQFTRRLSLGNAVAVEMLQGRGPVYLDCTQLPPDRVRLLWTVIPIIMNTFESAGYDISKDKIPYLPVLPATYGSSHGGGAVIGEKCMTSLPGLFAAGASSDGMNISPNLNLSWCMVLGWWAGEHAANYAKQVDTREIITRQVQELSQRQLKYLGTDGASFNDVHEKAARALHELGVVLTDEKLRRLRSVLLEILRDFDSVRARNPHDLVKVIGLRNALECLPTILEYLLHRGESRGSVVNGDHPETDNDKWLTLTKSRLGSNGKLQIWDEPIPAKEYYVHYGPKPGKSLHPLFKVLNRPS